MAQPLKLGERPVAEPGSFGVRLYGDLPGLSDQMGQPICDGSVAVADQDPGPGAGSSEPGRQLSDAAMGYRPTPLAGFSPSLH